MSEKIHFNLLPQELKHVYKRYQNIIQVLLNMKKSESVPSLKKIKTEDKKHKSKSNKQT